MFLYIKDVRNTENLLCAAFKFTSDVIYGCQNNVVTTLRQENNKNISESKNNPGGQKDVVKMSF